MVRVLGIGDVGKPAVLLRGPEVDVGVDDARGWAEQGAEAVAGGFAVVVLLGGRCGQDTGIKRGGSRGMGGPQECAGQRNNGKG